MIFLKDAVSFTFNLTSYHHAAFQERHLLLRKANLKLSHTQRILLKYRIYRINYHWRYTQYIYIYVHCRGKIHIIYRNRNRKKGDILMTIFIPVLHREQIHFIFYPQCSIVYLYCNVKKSKLYKKSKNKPRSRRFRWYPLSHFRYPVTVSYRVL